MITTAGAVLPVCTVGGSITAHGLSSAVKVIEEGAEKKKNFLKRPVLKNRVIVIVLSPTGGKVELHPLCLQMVLTQNS